MASSHLGAAKCLASAFRRSVTGRPSILRSGMGMPVGSMDYPKAPLPEEAELIWDDGSPYPEPCLDNVAPMVDKYTGLAWWCAGMGFFGLVGLLAVWNDKASKIPYTPREYPYDNLHVELGGEP